MSRDRQRRQSEEVRKNIIETAKRIIAEDGVEALSVRRLTSEMDYSTGIIYHYFENKEQIIDSILQEEYTKILHSLNPTDPDLPPDEALPIICKNFINAVFQNPEGYKMVMLSTSKQILEFTSVLGEQCVEKRPALRILASTIAAGVSKGVFQPCDINLTAQVIWSSIFGLLIRMITEQDVSAKQQSKLIDRHIDMIMKGLRK